MELTDRGECCLRPREHQEAHGVRDANRRRRPHPDSERAEHGCVGEQRRLEWREPMQRSGQGLVFGSDPDEFRRPRGRVRKSGWHHAELRDGDPRRRRSHGHPGSTDGPLHCERHCDDVVVGPRERRPLRDRQLGRARRLDAIEPRRRDPARGARAGRHDPARDEGQPTRGGRLLQRLRRIPLAGDDRGRMCPRLLRRGEPPPSPGGPFPPLPLPSPGTGWPGARRVSGPPDFGPGSRDIAPPVASASLSGTAGAANWYVSPVDVTLSATDDSSGVASIHFRTDGGTWQLYSNPVTVQGDGSHAIDYYATDLAGNNETARTSTFQIDTVGPVSSAQVSGTLANDGSYLSSVSVTLTSSDATSGVQSEQYRIDGGPWRTYSAPFTLGGNGPPLLAYFAPDVAGNSEVVRGQSIWITSDFHPLPVSILTSTGTAGAAGWYVSAVTVTITATSGSGSAVSIAYRLDGNGWATYAMPIVLRDGRHVLEYLATDGQGYSEASKSAAINADSTPPSLVANPPSIPLAPDASISWSGSDSGSGIARYEVAIDGSAFASVGLQTTLTHTWSVGTHVVSVRAYDAAGNMKSSVIQFSVESNPTPASPSGAPSAPPGIAEIIVGLVMLAVSMWFRPRVVTRRPAPRA